MADMREIMAKAEREGIEATRLIRNGVGRCSSEGFIKRV
jgi:hypothetical protein